MGYLIYQTIYSSRRPLSLLYSVFLWIISIVLSSIPSLVRSLCSDLYIRCLRTRSIPSFRFYLVCSCLSVHSSFMSLPWFVSCVSSFVNTWSIPLFLLGLFLSLCSFPIPFLPWFVPFVSISNPSKDVFHSFVQVLLNLFLSLCLSSRLFLGSFRVFLFLSTLSKDVFHSFVQRLLVLFPSLCS